MENEYYSFSGGRKTIDDEAFSFVEPCQQSLFTSMVQGVALYRIILDDKGNPVDYLIIEINPSYERIFGCPREEIIGQLATDIYGATEPPYLQQYSEVVRTNLPSSLDVYCEHLDKHFEMSIVPWEVNGFATILSDITERKKAEQSLKHQLESQILLQDLERKQHIMALRESENYYRAILENTGTAILIIEKDLTIIKANREWERLYGYTQEELEGTKWSELFLDEVVETMKEHHYSRRTGTRGIPARYNSRIRDKAGKVKDCMVIVGIIPGTSRSVAACIDMSEHHRINRALRTTSAVNMTMLNAYNEQSLLEIVCQKIVDIGGYRLAWVGYIGSDAQQTVLPVACAGYEQGYLNTLNIALADSKRGNGPAGVAIHTGQPYICRITNTEPQFSPWQEEAMKRGYKAVIAIPLIAEDGTPWGALSIYSEREDVFDKEEEKLLTEMTGNLVYGISSLRARSERNLTAKKLKISLEKLHRVLHQTVESLATSLETRDPYTAGHQERVSRLARAIAKEMGLSEDQIEGVTVAGSIHDIGKIVVPSEILSKPGKISDVEYMLIQTHSQAGYDIIKNIEFPWPVGEIILQHHERIDGSGYPQGLKGDQILLTARILAVADVVESIAFHRPYRAGLGVGKALEEISEQKGLKYDSEVVDACITLLREKRFILA